MAARRAVLAWAARLIQNWLNADESDRRNSAVLCRCGYAARYVERRKKRVQSALGELDGAGLLSLSPLRQRLLSS
jgi:hypothetical protein